MAIRRMREREKAGREAERVRGLSDEELDMEILEADLRRFGLRREYRSGGSS